jgi:L-fuculose-phosphate aldolase
MGEASGRRRIVEVGRRMRALGLVVAREGNLSLRLPGGRFLTTPAGSDKGRLQEDELVVVDGRGQALDGKRPSSEILMHLALYEERPDIAAVAHGHPPHATAFAVAGRGLEQCLLPEVVVDLGRVPLSDYATPSTAEMADSIRGLARDHHAILLRNHGAVAMGESLSHALDRLETVEQLARVTWIAEGLGGARALTEDQVQSLMKIRSGYGLVDQVASCSAGDGPGNGSSEEERLRHLVQRRKRELRGGGNEA